MEKGTPIGKLRDLNFFVYLYSLGEERTYKGVEGRNTIGFGYVGGDGMYDAGMARVNEGICWLRQSIPELKAKYGKDFPDAVQYEVFEHLDKDISMTVGDILMDEHQGREWIEEHLLERGDDTNGLSEYLSRVLGDERYLMRLEGEKRKPIMAWDALMHLIDRLNSGDPYY